ncbi:MAG TPA: hypothetical protein VMV18_15805 [bacterium]|nr:hypothetical protein [bacterium]
MTGTLLALVMLAARPAAGAPAPASPPDLSGIVDAALLPDAEAARAQAAKLFASASAEDASRAKLEADRKVASDELAAKQAELPSLSGSKKSLTASRIAELSTRVQSLNGTIAERVNAARSDRARAAEQQALSAALLAEDALRKKQAKDAIAPDADLSTLPDARLKAGKAWLAVRLARAPKQVAAIERQLDQTDGATNRGALVAAADAVRAEAAAEQDQVQRIDDELRFRADAKTDDVRAADNLAKAAAARAAEEAEENKAMALSTAHSAALDRKLDQIIAAADEQTARTAAMKSWALWSLRMVVLVLFVGAGIAAVLFAVRRK